MPATPSRTHRPKRRRRLALHWWIFCALAIGVVVGVVVNQLTVRGHLPPAADGGVVGFLAQLNGFVGDLFLRLLRFIAAPIVLFSLIVGAASLNDLKKLSRIGGKTIAIYLCTTALAITIGLVIANVVKPGSDRFVPAEVRDRLAAQGAGEATARIQAAVKPDVWETVLNLVPANPFGALAAGEMLQIVFAALAVGIALTLIPREKAGPVIAVCDGMTDAIIKIVHLVMLVAPVAVFCLIAGAVADLGVEVLRALAVYSLVVVAGLAFMMFAVYPAILRLLTPVRYGRFFKAIAPAQLLAFSSSSSSATLPVTMDCVENRLGVSEDVTSFAVPLGATINMDGTALYQGVAAVFIAQLYGLGVDGKGLSLGDQLTIVLTATLASIGTAGVPGVGMIMLVIVLQSVGMDPAVMAGGIAIIFGVDRVLDMCRTSVNVTGDCMVAAVVASSERELATEEEVQRRLAAQEKLDEFTKAQEDRERALG
jgi:Na+/H+-dicarboxylate symporter